MWIDSKECVPFKDGEYLVQTVFGDVRPLMYTFEGGWNTHRDENGKVQADNRMENDGYIARWFLPPTPPTIPEAWVDEYTERR